MAGVDHSNAPDKQRSGQTAIRYVEQLTCPLSPTWLFDEILTLFPGTPVKFKTGDQFSNSMWTGSFDIIPDAFENRSKF